MDADKLKYAKAFVTQYLRRDVHLAPHADDLVQEALMGIMEAAKRFDPSRGGSLATVEWVWMQAKCSRYLAKVLRFREDEVVVRTVGGEEMDALNSCADEGTSPEVAVQEAHDYMWFVNAELPRRVKSKRLKGEAATRAHDMALARLKGASLRDIGDMFNVSRERARQIIATLDFGTVE